jgi:hypothetical protein
MLAGWGGQGEKMAAWQNAQVASSWTGGGSDSRGALIVGPVTGWTASGGSAPAATPTARGSARRSSRNTLPSRTQER